MRDGDRFGGGSVFNGEEYIQETLEFSAGADLRRISRSSFPTTLPPIVPLRSVAAINRKTIEFDISAVTGT